jgi:hypothetical protein
VELAKPTPDYPRSRSQIHQEPAFLTKPSNEAKACCLGTTLGETALQIFAIKGQVGKILILEGHVTPTTTTQFRGHSLKALIDNMLDKLVHCLAIKLCREDNRLDWS